MRLLRRRVQIESFKEDNRERASRKRLNLTVHVLDIRKVFGLRFFHMIPGTIVLNVVVKLGCGIFDYGEPRLSI